MSPEAIDSRSLLIVIHSLRGGGAGKVCATVANGLSRRGWRVTVAVNLDDDAVWREEFSPTVAVVLLGTRHARRSGRALRTLMEERRPATILAFNYQLALMLLWIRRHLSYRPRLVGRMVIALSEGARIKGFWQREIVTRLVRRHYRRLDAVVAQSEGMKRDLIESFSVPDEKLAVIYNAAPEPPGSLDRPGRLDPLEKRVPTLLYLGRFKPQKQPRLLVELLREVRSRPGCHACRLLAAGDGPLRDEFLAAAEAAGLASAIDYRGYVRDTAALFAEADVTVLVSRYEGFPNSLVESLACGVPVASFDCPTGPDEIVIPGVNGVLAPTGDVVTLADGIARLIADRPEPTTIRRTATRFSLPAILDEWERVLIGDRSGAGSSA